MSEPTDEKPKQPLDKGSQIYQEMIRAGLAQMDGAVAEINAESESRQRMVPEVYFVQNLLPILRKWVRNDPKDLAQPGLWFNVAGGLNHPMRVAGPDGKFLFEAPPLFVDIPTRNRAGPEGMVSIHQLVDMQGHMFDNGDQRAAFEVESELVSILEPKPEQVAKTEALVKLVHIYRRYDLPLKELVGDAAAEIEAALAKQTPAASGTTAPAAKSSGIDDDEEYEI